MNNIDEMFNNVGLHKYKLFIQSYPMSFIFHFNLKQLSILTIDFRIKTI